MAVVSTDRRDTLSYRKKMECSDGSGISSRVYNGREDGVMGSLAARRVAEGDWAGVWEAVIVDLFPGLTARWNSSIPSAIDERRSHPCPLAELEGRRSRLWSGESRRSGNLMRLRRYDAETKHPGTDAGLDFMRHLRFRP